MKTVHVAFRGQPEFLIEVVAGRVQFGVAGLGPALPLIRDGKLILLAVGPQRSVLFPHVPALTGRERSDTGRSIATFRTARIPPP